MGYTPQKPLITQALLLELFDYDAETGMLKRKEWASRQPGTNVSDGKYVCVMIRGWNYKAHRLIWMYHYGCHPKGVIDHINGIKTDNRIENLRDVTPSVNAHNVPETSENNKHGLRGVSRLPSGRYRAEIIVKGKYHSLGSFDSAEEASEAYVMAKRRLTRRKYMRV
jgi:hypothetical protein